MPVSSRRRSTVLSQFPAIALLTFAVGGLAGCGDSGPSAPSAPGSPSQPSAASTPAPKGELTVFTDPATGFSTTDLRDVQEQIVQLSSIGELIWTADGTRLPGIPGHPPDRGREAVRHRRQDLPRASVPSKFASGRETARGGPT